MYPGVRAFRKQHLLTIFSTATGSTGARTRLLSEATLAADADFFWRRRYLIVRNVFSGEEMEIAKAAIQTNERKQRQT
jgi:hypothetical protein